MFHLPKKCEESSHCTEVVRYGVGAVRYTSAIFISK
jgi:hypothetical protein